MNQDWKSTNLGSLATYINGRGFKKSEWRDSGIPIVRIQNLTGTSEKINYFDGALEDKHQIKRGDLLLSWAATLDVYEYDQPTGALNQHIFKVESLPGVNKKYLFYLLKTKLAALYAQTHGSGMVHITSAKFKATPAILPSPEVQEKIVAKIEELFSEIDNADAELLSATRLENIYKQAIIDSTFDAIAVNHKMTTLDDNADIRGGVTKGRKLSNVDIVQIPYLRVANVQDGYLDLKEIKHIPGTTMDLEKYQLQYGDILFTEGGDKDKLGRGTVWRNEVEGCIHQNHIFRARVDLAKNDPEFISLAAQTTKSRHYFFSKAKQTTNLASINMTQLKLLEIPDVPIGVQREALAKIKELIEETDRTKRSIALCSDYSQSLKQSILSKAFKGELV